MKSGELRVSTSNIQNKETSELCLTHSFTTDTEVKFTFST